MYKQTKYDIGSDINTNKEIVNKDLYNNNIIKTFVPYTISKTIDNKVSWPSNVIYEGFSYYYMYFNGFIKEIKMSGCYYFDDLINPPKVDKFNIIYENDKDSQRKLCEKIFIY